MPDVLSEVGNAQCPSCSSRTPDFCQLCKDQILSRFFLNEVTESLEDTSLKLSQIEIKGPMIIPVH